MPVARVAVDYSLPHLDRPFDYLVARADVVVPGCRVRVRFAGRLVDGFVLERVRGAASTRAAGAVSKAWSSPEPCSARRSPRWPGPSPTGRPALADVLRLAVPPRHAAVEKQADRAAPDAVAASRDPARLDRRYAGGAGAPRRCWPAAAAAGRAGRAARRGLAGPARRRWPRRPSPAAAARSSSCPTTATSRARRRRAAAPHSVPDGTSRLTADLGPAERYRRFLRVAAAQVRCVVGTRAAVFAPVRDLGLVVVWDDGDDLHAEPRAPYPTSARSLLTAGPPRRLRRCRRRATRVTAERRCWSSRLGARLVGPTPPCARGALPAVRSRRATTTTSTATRRRGPPGCRASPGGRPATRWRRAPGAGAGAAARLPAVAAPARLPHAGPLRACAGPLARPAAARGCRPAAGAAPAPPTGAARSAAAGLRAAVVGAGRTAEELGRAFPGVAGPHVRRRRTCSPTSPPSPRSSSRRPGAEPVADGGYGAALLLDSWALLGRADLRAGEEALRRWLDAAALVRPAADGGRVVVVAAGRAAPGAGAGALGPGWHAERELADRGALRLPACRRGGRGHRRAGRAWRSCWRWPSCRPAPRCSARCRRAAGRGEERRERLLVRVPRASGARAGRGAARCGGDPQRPQGRRRGPGRARPRRPSADADSPRRGPRCSDSDRPASRHRATLPAGRSRHEESSRDRHSRSGCSATRCCARPPTPVDDFDKELRELVKDLTETMLDAPGAGLAAPQIGVGLRVFTYDVDDEVGHLVNPVLDVSSDEEQDGDEGCLSFPGLAFPTPRAHARGRQGLQHVRRAGDRSRAASCWPAASSTRPTTSTACCSSTGSTPSSASWR